MTFHCTGFRLIFPDLIFVSLLFGSPNGPLLSSQQSTSLQVPTVKPASPEAFAEVLRLNKEVNDLFKQGHYDAAMPLAERALIEAQRLLPPNHPLVITSLNSLALLRQTIGEYDLAEKLYQRAVMISETSGGPSHPLVALSLNGLASLYQLKGDLIRAESLLLRALAIDEKAYGPDHSIVAGVLMNLGALYQVKGDDARAEPLYQRALKIAEKLYQPGNPLIAIPLNSLGWLYLQRKEYTRAEPLLQRALAIVEKARGKDHPDVAGLLNFLAMLYQSTGDFFRAESLNQRALAIHEKALGIDHPITAASMTNLANLYLEKGEYDLARPLYEHALAIREKFFGRQSPVVAESLRGLALLCALKGKTVEAIHFLTVATEISEHNLALMLTTGSEHQKRLYLATLSGETDGAISLHLRMAPNNSKALKLALTTILRRKGRTLDAMTDQVGALRRHLAPQDRELFDELSATRSRLAALVLKGGTQVDRALQFAEVGKLQTEIEQLEGQISVRSAEFRMESQPVTVARVQNAIPVDAALIEFISYRPLNPRNRTTAEWFDTPHYAAYILRRTGLPTWVELGQAPLIDRAALELRATLANPESTKVKTLGRALDELVMRPVRRNLLNKRRIFISPDGTLNLIPFSALVDEDDHYLIENYTISYLTSGRDLLRFDLKAQSRQGPVVIADPAFNFVAREATNSVPGANQVPPVRSADLSGVRFRRLVGTAQEASALKNILADAKILTGEHATEAAVKQVSGPLILHIATHGFFLPDQPQKPVTLARALGLSDQVPVEGSENTLLRSGLALAGANKLNIGASEDGILTALEAAGLDLWGTKLVVLSACETAVGEVENGEGVQGLRRAIMLAGAESELISLWQISDTATRDLMIAYYKRLMAREGRAEAFRQVQLGMLNSKTENRSHPFYWASFIPVGNWRSLLGH